tara:strand:+ start:2131 stop:3159 length:1029 start_codon:yes stop_codon:yes gene_type:complete
VPEYLKNHNAPFTIGNDESWLVEKRYFHDGEIIDLDIDFSQKINLPITDDSVIDKQRTGWYLTPNPMHAAIRNFLNWAVIILLISLGYLFLQPILDIWGLGGFGTGRVRFGLLDYPILAVFVLPILFAPIILRVVANLSDLVKQRTFLLDSPRSPNIKIDNMPTANEELNVEIKFPKKNSKWMDIEVLWRVGVLPPSRESLMTAFGKKTNQQPPPGLTTELPHHWHVNLDDGTGGGEDSPMESNDVKGGLFIRPMRIMEQSENVKLKNGKVSLKPPKGFWPGTVFSPLIRVHWELVIMIKRESGRSLMWVEPLNVQHPKNKSSVEANVNSGRTETNHPSTIH